MTRLVDDYDEVVRSAQRFNDALERVGTDDAANHLADRLAYNRSWYYLPELDIVAPSKFIGYAKMTASRYVQPSDLDGRATEPRLQRWFRPLAEGSPEHAFVRARVETLLSKHNKALNRAVRFSAPVGWKATGGGDAGNSVRDRGSGRGRRVIHATVVRGESQFVAQCDELSVVTQGATVDQTLENLKEAITLHLDGEDLEALGLAPDPVVLVTMELLPWAA